MSLQTATATASYSCSRVRSSSLWLLVVNKDGPGYGASKLLETSACTTISTQSDYQQLLVPTVIAVPRELGLPSVLQQNRLSCALHRGKIMAALPAPLRFGVQLATVSNPRTDKVVRACVEDEPTDGAALSPPTQPHPPHLRPDAHDARAGRQRQCRGSPPDT